MSRGTPDGKRTRELLRLLPPGYQLVKEGRRPHLAVLRPDGSRLRDEKGVPISVAATTRVGVKATLARVLRAIERAGP